MTTDITSTELSPIDHTALKLAVKNLENPNFAARLADYAGIPVNRVLSILPKVANEQLSVLVRTAVMKGLDVAIETLEGPHIVSPGDFVIIGVKGERYACKPDIFEATYELE